MAITLTVIAQSPTKKVYSVKSLDADTSSGNVAHGLIGTPTALVFTPSTAVIAAAVAAAVTADATNVVFLKANAAGSGGATPGTTVIGNLAIEYVPSV